MATLSLNADIRKGSTLLGRVSALFNYTVSSTDTTITVTYNSAKLAYTPSGQPGTANITAVMRYGSETGQSATSTISGGGEKTVTVSKSVKSFSRGKTTATQTITFYLTASVEGIAGSGAGSNEITASVNVPAKPSYSVTYNANGGSGAPAAQTKWYGENLTLQSGEPTRTNYVFKNWNTKADGSGTTYNKGATYTANAALTLYAQWYAPYTVSYNANGGTGAPASQTKVYNKALTLTSTKPNRTDWLFSHWYTTASGSGGTRYNSGASYTANANATLYAQWIRQISKVTIGTIKSIRVDDDTSTTESEEGTHAYIRIPFTVTGSAAGNVSMTVTATAASGTAPTVTIVSGTATKTADNTLNGTFIARASGCDLDVEYTFTVTITATNTSATQTAVKASRKDVLSTAFFTMDVLAGGHGIAFGKAAKKQNLFECEWDAQFNNLLKVFDVEPMISQQTSVYSSEVGQDIPPSSSWDYFGAVRRYDKNGRRVFYLETVKNSDDAVYTNIITERNISGSNVQHGVYMGIRPNGALYVTFPNATSKEAWKTGLDYYAVTNYTHTDFRYESNAEAYSTSGSGAPRAYKHGRVVTLTGNFKSKSTITSSTTEVRIGYVPTGCEPATTIRVVSQGSDMNRFLLSIGSDGAIVVSRYGSASYVDIPTGAWLNICCTYISAS